MAVFISYMFSPLVLTIVSITLLYYLSRTFQFYFRLCLYYIVMFLICLVGIPIAAVTPGKIENINTVAKMMCTVSLYVFGLEWHVQGKENLPSEEVCVVVSNHQSVIDVHAMMAVWPLLVRCVSMVKKELRYALSFGVFACLVGTVFIDRSNPEKAKQTVNDTVNYLKSRKTKVYIFPEGTRNPDGGMLPFKKGAFHLAVQGQIPILPVVFSNYSHIFNSKKKLFKSGSLKATILPPVSTEGLTSSDVGDLAERVRAIMLEVFEGKNEINTANDIHCESDEIGRK